MALEGQLCFCDSMKKLPAHKALGQMIQSDGGNEYMERKEYYWLYTNIYLMVCMQIWTLHKQESVIGKGV